MRHVDRLTWLTPRTLASLGAALAAAGLALGTAHAQPPKPPASETGRVKPDDADTAKAGRDKGGRERKEQSDPPLLRDLSSNPVRALQQLLKDKDFADLATDARLEEQVDSIIKGKQVGDLAEAFLLWPVAGQFPEDEGGRKESAFTRLTGALMEAVQDAVNRRDPEEQIAIATFVGDLVLRAQGDSTTTPGLSNPPKLAALRGLINDILPLADSSDPQVRLALARALGRVRLTAALNPAEDKELEKQVGKDMDAEGMKWPPALDIPTERQRVIELRHTELYDRGRARVLAPEVAAVVGTLVRLREPGQDPAVRRAAAEALVDLLRPGSPANDSTRQPVNTRPTGYDLLRYGTAIVPAAAAGLALEPDLAVPSARALLQVLTEALEDYPRPGPKERGLDIERARSIQRTGPLAKETAKALPAVAEAAVADSPDLRRLAREILEAAGEFRAIYRLAYDRLVDEGEIDPKVEKGQFPRDPFAEKLPAAADSLIAGLADPDPALRRTAVEALEQLASPPGKRSAATRPLLKTDLLVLVTQALTRSAGDPDRFVRWPAVRALGRIGLVDGVEAAAVAALARALADPEYAVRLAASTALLRYGPKAAPAAEALAMAVGQPDIEPSLAAIRALISIGPDGRAAVPALVNALTDADVRKRRLAAEALMRLGRDAAPAAPALRAAVNDPDSQVRSFASDALLRIRTPTPPAPTPTPN